MYRSNRSFNITLDNPPGLYNFWKTSVKISPSPGQKVVQIPHHRSILGDAGDSNSVPDPDLEMRGRGRGAVARPLDKGGPVFQKNFFRAPGPQSGLKIRGELGPLPCIRHCFPTLMHRNQIPHLPEDYDFQIPFTGEVKGVNSLA